MSFKGKKHKLETIQKLKDINPRKVHVPDPENYPKWSGGIPWLLRLEAKAGRRKPKNCELCGEAGKICFDHDHKTGKFRGWICTDCNIALGRVKDNIQILKLMIEYIKNNEGCE